MEEAKALIDVLRELPGRDWIYQNRRFHHCFQAKEAVNWFVQKGTAVSDAPAMSQCQYLYAEGMLQGVGHTQPPGTGSYYYYISSPSPVLPINPANPTSLLQDECNAEMLRCVHPPYWEDPIYEGKYDVLAIGGGAAGLISAIVAGQQGARAALIEGEYMGGDCLVSGCVPSKALLKCANEFARAKQLANYGIRLSAPPVADFGFMMERMRRLRSEIAHHDSAERISNDFGIDVYIGTAHFTNSNQVRVNDKFLTFRKCVIATGAKPYIPPIAGLENVRFYTSETIWDLTELPEAMTLLGGGPVACELSQAFARLGSKVSLVTVSATLLPKEEPEAAELLADVLQSEGVSVYTNSTIVAVTKDTETAFSVHIAGPYSIIIPCNCLFIAAGRTPNTDSLSLENASIRLKDQLLDLNEYLQTSNPDIYAAGDVCGLAQFTHAADAMARLSVSNALQGNNVKYSDLTIPRCIYTDPEVAHVGESAQGLIAASVGFNKTRREWKGNDRKLVEGDTVGFVQLLTSGSRLMGATVVGTDAGALLPEITLAITCGLGLEMLVKAIHPYPTPGETVKQCAVAALTACSSP